ncbi:MAG: DNA polymerase III subunit gamma/tau [bacterium]
MATLYRKYRPQKFVEVVGQNHIKLTLEHEIKSDRIAHSYLFCGPRAVGKTTLARVLAKALNCDQIKEKESEPCNTCQSCKEITEGRALDIIEIDAASNTGVDNVRENIIANARMQPTRLKYKVFIIDEVHMLSASAFNALLKIMEEPPSYVVFILCTTEVHKIPMTVISRCQRFDFKKISVVDIVKKLEYIIKQEKIKIDKPILEAIARHSGGHMRDAESLLGQIVALGERQEGESLQITQEDAELVIPRNDLNEVISLIELMAKKDVGGAVRLVNKLVDDGFDLKDFTNDLIEILRQMILTKINPDLIVTLGVELGESLEAKLVEVNNKASVNLLLSFIEKFIKAKDELKTTFIAQLPLEMAIIEVLNEEQQVIRPSKTEQVEKNYADQQFTQAEKRIKANINNLQLDQVVSKWSEFLNRVKQDNHSLSFTLKVCQPTSIEGNELCVTFNHKIHKDKIEEPQIRETLEKALQDVYGADLILKANLDENLKIGNNNGNDDENGIAIDSLLKTLGGKVVK